MSQPITKLLLLNDLLAQMPGTKPRSTKQLIKSWEWKTGAFGLKPKKAQSVTVGDITLEPEVLFEMCYSDGSQWGKDAVSPRAAKILIELYLDGHLETKSKPASVEAIGHDVIDYANSTLTLKDILSAGREEEARKRTARLESLARPLDQISESEFTETFLHDLFMHHKITNGSLTIAGIKVTKILSQSSSNSGKSHGWNESFTWIGSDGQHHQEGTQSPYDSNRRNDANRNWGLGRD